MTVKESRTYPHDGFRHRYETSSDQWPTLNFTSTALGPSYRVTNCDFEAHDLRKFDRVNEPGVAIRETGNRPLSAHSPQPFMCALGLGEFLAIASIDEKKVERERANSRVDGRKALIQ